MAVVERDSGSKIPPVEYVAGALNIRSWTFGNTSCELRRFFNASIFDKLLDAENTRQAARFLGLGLGRPCLIQ
jgi:hypothetical protein